MKILKTTYKNVLKHIFFKINKPYLLDKNHKNSYLEKKVSIGKKNYKIFTLKNGSIYMDTSESKYFYIYRNLILPNLSIDIKGLRGNSNIFKYGITKFCKKFDLDVVSIVSGRDAKDNYYHWLIDVLPRLIILEKEFNKSKDINLLVPDCNISYQKESLNCFFKNKKINLVSLYNNKFSQFKKIILCSNNENFEYLNYYLLSKLKKIILHHEKKKKFIFNKTFEKIYISRADALKKNNRYLKNNLEIEKFLSKSGFKILILSKYSFLEQAMIFNRAKVIIGLHGAGFANIVFSKKKTKIIEITYPRWVNNIEKLSKCMSLSYNKIMATKVDKTTNTIDLSISKIQKYI